LDITFSNIRLSEVDPKIGKTYLFLLKWVIIGSLFFVFNVFFWQHYSSHLIPEANIFKSLVVINLAFIIALTSIIKFKDVINPIALYSIYIFFAGYSYLPISFRQNMEYSWLTELILFLSILCFIIGVLLNRTVYIVKLKPFSRKVVKGLFITVMISAIIVFILEIRLLGYVPILNLASGIDVYGETMDALIPFAHYLVLFMALVPAIAYIFYKENRINKFSFIVICAVGFFIIVNFLSRQTIMLLMLSLFYAYLYFNKVSLTKALSIGGVIIGMFVIVGNLRAGSGSGELVGGINTFLKTFAGIDKDVSLAETYMTLYASQNFTTLDEIVKAAYEEGRIFLGIYTFKPIISFTFLDRLGIINYDIRFDGFKRLGTYALDPFLDFHLLGVIIINLVFGFISMNTYRSFKSKKNTQAIINWSLLTFCIIMSPFTNFFISFFIWIAFLINIAITNTKAPEEGKILYL